MKITDALLGEHAVFNVQFNHLQREGSGAHRFDEFRGQAGMLLAALQSHADLEDELLLTPMEPHLGTQNSLVSILRSQHEEIEVTLAKVLEAGHPVRAAELLLRVTDLLRDHFEREEQVLYPSAEKLLGGDSLTRLGQEWSQRRGVALAPRDE
ncbi:MAG: hemerythrin domain-containing protein [Acidobacteria bacterium]|nr:hemerythrin domain-containing protein [Acidobacteriota bacterium]